MNLKSLPPWHAAYVGIPFVEHGRDRAGCDCWGLVRLVWKEQAGLDVPCHGTVYGATRDGRPIADAIRAGLAGEEEWEPVPAGDERPFDAVLMKGFWWDEEAEARKVSPIHVGLVLAPGTLLHIEHGTGAVLVDYRADRTISRRVVGFWRPVMLMDRGELEP